MSWRMWLVPLVSLAAAAFAAAPDTLTGERQAQLRNLVVQDCGSCHGLTLKGGLGKPLLPASLGAFSDEAVAEVILDGISGTPMPAWRGLLTETEALWIAHTLKRGLEE